MVALSTAVLLASLASSTPEPPVRTRSPEAAEALLAEAGRREWVQVREIGRSAGGRPLVAVRLGRPQSAPEWRVLLLGGQHGDEPAGREALLELVRLIAADPLRLPPEVEVWLVPTANPDGTAAGTRRNGAGADLNRDWLTLGQPETRAIHALAREVRPDLAVDLHEFDRSSRDWREAGWDEWPLLTLDTANHPLLPDAVYRVGLDWIALAAERMAAAGIPFRRYLVGGVPPREELRPSTLDPDDARNGLALLGSLGFIVESGIRRADPDPGADLHLRVAAHLELLDLFLRDPRLRAPSTAAAAQARQAPPPAWIPVNSLWASSGLEVHRIEAVDRATGAVVEIPTANLMDDRVVKRAVPAPAAYAVPPPAAAPFAALLQRHGLGFEELTGPRPATVERCRLERLEQGFDDLYQRYGGRQVVSCAAPEPLPLPEGTLVVPLSGPDAARAAALLEPLQLYGLYQLEEWRSEVGEDGTLPVLRVAGLPAP